MSTHLFDFMWQPLPLRLRHAQQFRTDDFAQVLKVLRTGTSMRPKR
ncbi:MAG TPA: hypothetical protein VLA66_01920 [Thermoanaerobaculia bacterium]|nr:hypothetical protein [Thermoanaerobaculia bacterium]